MELDFKKLIATKTGLADRAINWGVGPEGLQSPFINISFVNDRADLHHDGLAKTRQAIIQVDLYHTDFAEISRLKKIIQSIGYPDVQGTISGISLSSTRFSSSESNNLIIHKASFDFKVFYFQITENGGAE